MATRRLLLVLCLLCPFGFTAARAQSTHWVEYASQEGSYRVEFPGTPQKTDTPLAAPAGSTQKLFTHRASYNVSADFSLSVNYTDVPQFTLPETVLDNQVAATSKLGRLRDMQKVVSGGFPARRLTIDATAQGKAYVMKVLLVCSRSHSYTLIVAIASAFEESPDASSIYNRFMSSFKVIEPKA